MDKTETTFDYNSISPGYYDEVFRKAKGPQSKWHHHKFAFVRSRLGEYQKHLDIGCGPGTFIGTLISGGRSVGVDLSGPQIVYAGDRYGGAGREFKQLNAGEPFQFADETFDKVTLIELIEHIERPQTLGLLKETRRLLKKGGRAIITTPNYASAWPLVEAVLNKVSPVSYEEQHIAKYTKPLLKELLKEAGFADIFVGSFLWSAPFWAAVSWRLSDRINALEKGMFRSHGGFLLIGEAVKS